MGEKIVGGVFAASQNHLLHMAERQASILESIIRGRHICKQIWRLLLGEILTLEREEGYNHDKFAVSLLKHATVLGRVPREFSRVFSTSSGTERPSLVKLPIEESVVNYFPALVLFVLDTLCSKIVY